MVHMPDPVHGLRTGLSVTFEGEDLKLVLGPNYVPEPPHDPGPLMVITKIDHENGTVTFDTVTR